jgi:hypothetical protein
MHWPESRFGDGFGGLGNTFEEACANKRKTDEEADARRLARLKKYQPEAIDISDDGQFVVVSWRMAMFRFSVKWRGSGPPLVSVPPLSGRGFSRHKGLPIRCVLGKSAKGKLPRSTSSR